MTTRRATCMCGSLSATCEGEPLRSTICHCLECKRRSGSAFGWNTRWTETQVTFEGAARVWTRRGSEGPARFSFCPGCGTTVFYRLDAVPGMVMIPAGGFAEVDFPPPTFSIFEERACPWVTLTADPLERWD